VRLSVTVVIVRTMHGVCNFSYAGQTENRRRSSQNVPLFSRYIKHQHRRLHTAPSPTTGISTQTESASRPSRDSYAVCKTNIADRWCCVLYLFKYLLIPLTFWRRNYFFLILAHTAYKMWIIQEPNTLELWNKLHFEEKKRRVYTTFKISGTYIC